MSALLGNAAPSSGTKNAQVGAIKAILLNGTYLKTATGGDKYVAANTLIKYLRDQMVSIATTDSVPAERQAAVAAVGARVEIVPKVVPWANVVARDNWETHPEWPAVSELSNAEKTTSFIKNTDALKAVSTRLTEHYEYLKTDTVDGINRGYDAVVATYDLLPEVTVREQDSRSYVYTYVDDWNWESAPSEPSAVQTVDNNDIVTIAATAPPAGRNIKKIRLYRSASGNSGAAFQFVIENPSPVDDAGWTNPANRSYIDTKKQAELQEVCPTMLWIEPLVDLFGLQAMPNGAMIGFEGNNICFCESFKPYAWPLEYRLTTEHKIVGGGVFGQTAVVLTEGFPYYVSGSDSATMSAQKLEFMQSCVSKRTIKSVDGGVMYASPDGICLAGSGGVTNILSGAVSRADWQVWLGAQNLWPLSFAAYHEGIYYIFNHSGSGYAVDIAGRKISNLTQVCSGIYSDLITDKLYVVSSTNLLELFGGAGNNNAAWKSRIFVLSEHPAFSCMRVESNFESDVTIKLYGDGALRYTTVFDSRSPQRLPAGKYRDYEIQVEASCPVTRVTMATTMSELAST